MVDGYETVFIDIYKRLIIYTGFIPVGESIGFVKKYI